MNDRYNPTRRTWIIVATFAAIAFAVSGTGRADDEMEIELEKVPADIRKVAEEAAPKVKWASVTKSTEDEVVYYEFVGKNAKNREIWVTIADGTVEDIQTEIPAAEVPKAVKDALKKAFPAFKFTKIWEVKEEGKVARFDFYGKRPKDKEEVAISVSADGKTVEVDEE